MSDIVILGTSGSRPQVNRKMASACFRSMQGVNILFDCGEGTQVSCMQYGVKINSIAIICITHLHQDHIAGLVPLITTMASSGREKHLTIIGPVGIKEYLARSIFTKTFSIHVIEISPQNTGKIFYLQDITLSAFEVKHTVPCFAYKIKMRGAPKCDIKKAQRNNVPRELFTVLQEKNVAFYKGKKYTIDMISVGHARKYSMVYCTDTKFFKGLIKLFRDTDLVVCEGFSKNPKSYAHLSTRNARYLAKRSNCKFMILTHYSPESFYPEGQKISPNIVYGYDGLNKSCNFREVQYER